MTPAVLIACGGDGVPETAEPGDEFCELAEVAKERGDDIDDVDFTDSGDVEDVFADALEASEAAATEAPKDIADDFNERLELQREVVALLEDYDYDMIEAFEDEDLLELGEDLDQVGEDVDAYLEDKCDIEIDEEPVETTPVVSVEPTPATVPSPEPTIEDIDALPDGLITRENFLDFYAIGAGVEVTQEMKDCFAEEIKDLSDEDFDGAVNESSDVGTLAIGSAILACDIPIAG
jgi:hypothetical protein